MKKYSKYYKLVTSNTPDGKTKQTAEYIGKYYICQLDEIKLKKVKLYFFALVLCSGATAIGAGFLNNPGSKVIYIALPYVSLFLPIVFAFLGTIKFMTAGNRLDQATYDKSKIRIFRSTIWQTVLSSMTIVGDIIFIFSRKSKDTIKNEFIFAGSMLVILSLNIVFLKLQKKVIYQVEDSVYNN